MTRWILCKEGYAQHVTLRMAFPVSGYKHDGHRPPPLFTIKFLAIPVPDIAGFTRAWIGSFLMPQTTIIGYEATYLRHIYIMAAHDHLNATRER